MTHATSTPANHSQASGSTVQAWPINGLLLVSPCKDVKFYAVCLARNQAQANVSLHARLVTGSGRLLVAKDVFFWTGAHGEPGHFTFLSPLLPWQINVLQIDDQTPSGTTWVPVITLPCSLEIAHRRGYHPPSRSIAECNFTSQIAAAECAVELLRDARAELSASPPLDPRQFH
jgi:hypothetical protein